MALTDQTVYHAKAQARPYTLNDKHGVSLYVASNGCKSWHFRFSWQCKQQRISLGTYPQVSLKQARVLRDDARWRLAQGIDPRVHRQQTKLSQADNILFRKFAKTWLTFKLKRLDAQTSLEKKHKGQQVTAIQIERYLHMDILPALGDKTLRSITRADVYAVQCKIEQRNALSIAKKVRTWLKEIFSYAVLHWENSISTLQRCFIGLHCPIKNVSTLILISTKYRSFWRN